MLKFINKIIEGDCLDVLANFPDCCIDLVLCDLPYGTTNNPWDTPINLTDLWALYKRIIKPNGIVVLTGQGVFTAQLILSNVDMFKYKMVWIKSKATNFLNVKKQPLRKHEDICVFYGQQGIYNPQMSDGTPYDKGFRKHQTKSYNYYKPDRGINRTGKRHPTDTLFFEPDQFDDAVYVKSSGNGESGLHSTQKPVALGRYLIRTFSNEGAIVLDNACGSGSFLEAALLENRCFIGIEKNVKGLPGNKQIDFVKDARKRIEAAKQRLRLL